MISLSVKVSPLLYFQNSKVWISALEEDRKAMVFDIKGWLLPLANVRSEIKGLMPFTYDLLIVKCLKIHAMVYKELCLQDSWADKQGECSHKYVQLCAWNYVTLSKNSQSAITPTS